MAESRGEASNCAIKPSASMAASRELLTVGGDSLPFLERLLKQPGRANQRAQKPAQKPPGSGQAPPSMFTTPVAESSVLARLRGFLPQMEQENQKLQRAIEEQGQEAVSMEAVDDSQQHIEMDLSLGLVDLRTPDAVVAAERALVGGAGQGGSAGRREGEGEGMGEGVSGSSESDSELESESESSDGDEGGIRRANAHGGGRLGGEGRSAAMEEDGAGGLSQGGLAQNGGAAGDIGMFLGRPFGNGAAAGDDGAGGGDGGVFRVGVGGEKGGQGANMHPGQHKGGYGGRKKKGLGKAKKGVRGRGSSKNGKAKPKIVEIS
ncbi:hypothetical protein CLOM_g6545 [Closterium sp. NIES-68]|nr:hypothetical protein CLOM_g6545 [Closterium sp. NIES-68]GJP75693.1 hypothetical protein CLOP_g6109 [Closterium sp. NIES-67]